MMFALHPTVLDQFIGVPSLQIYPKWLNAQESCALPQIGLSSKFTFEYACVSSINMF